MAGIMGPKDAYDLVSAIKDAVPELPVVVHTHCTTGLAFMTYLKAVEAGADVIDTAISPFSGGTASLPPRLWLTPCASLATRWTWTTRSLVKMADFFRASGPTSWLTGLSTPSPWPPIPSA